MIKWRAREGKLEPKRIVRARPRDEIGNLSVREE